MSHVREARMLCRKTVELFTLISNTQETGARPMGMTQELVALVTGLAHYLKMLIRIALTGALKLERITSFLDKLHLLAVQGANPSAKRLIKSSHDEPLNLIPTPIWARKASRTVSAVSHPNMLGSPRSHRQIWCPQIRRPICVYGAV